MVLDLCRKEKEAIVVVCGGKGNVGDCSECVGGQQQQRRGIGIIYARTRHRGGRGNVGGKVGRVAVETEVETGRSSSVLFLVYIFYCLTCKEEGGRWSWPCTW